jgi:hypothetical protein
LPWAGKLYSRQKILCRASAHGIGETHGRGIFSGSDGFDIIIKKEQKEQKSI